ncbi:MAG: hypothetical protein ACI85Z_001847, partial [Rheinheimera aquimaris]
SAWGQLMDFLAPRIDFTRISFLKNLAVSKSNLQEYRV